MSRRDLLFVLLCLAGLAALGGALFPALDLPITRAPRSRRAEPALAVPDVVPRIDASFQREWAAAGIAPVARADDLTVARRLSLALVGSIPSLEEIRRFEAHPPADRLVWWTDQLLADERSPHYLAERLARAYVGVIPGPFVLYRRHRFVHWLADQLRENVPYDALVRQMIASEGLWTDHPATNFITVAIKPDTEEPPDPEVLAGRVARAFLAIRLDCAECHDHPLADWKQADFQGLAAYFAQTERSLIGIREGEHEYQAVLHNTGEEREVPPRVPFATALVPSSGSRRQQLAAWITAPENRAFARATVNRAWALLFGRPLVEPIDDIPPEGPHSPVLEQLADDFIAHRYNLRRLIRTIASLEVFRLESRGTDETPPTELQFAHWAAFSLVRLRPEQVVGAAFQASSLRTTDYQSHLILRFARALGQQEFIKRFGDAGEDEMVAAGGTIPQRLLMMNGELLHNATDPDPLDAPAHIGMLARDGETAVEIAYLMTLTRRPTAEESAHFADRLRNLAGEQRQQAVGDLCWTLLNSTEFNWNH